MIDVLMIIGGLVLLFFAGEGAVSLATNFGLSSLLVSAVIVGFGTSMPEMTVSISAALKGAADISVGNVVGSNIANILLIIGMASIIAPIAISAKAVRRDTLAMLLATFIMLGLSALGVIQFFYGLLMLAILGGYIAYSYSQDKKAKAAVVEHIQEDVVGEEMIATPKAVLYSLAGLIGLIIGAYMMVEGAVAIARDFGISEAVIGLTIVAVGTSLPELATAAVAAFRKHTDVILGNILGSNIFNIFSILGVTALITPVPVNPQIAAFDVWVMTAVALWLSFYLFKGKTIGMITGALMLVAYMAYTAWLYMAGAA